MTLVEGRSTIDDGRVALPEESATFAVGRSPFLYTRPTPAAVGATNGVGAGWCTGGNCVRDANTGALACLEVPGVRVVTLGVAMGADCLRACGLSTVGVVRIRDVTSVFDFSSTFVCGCF